jgi:hypothetical protein
MVPSSSDAFIVLTVVAGWLCIIYLNKGQILFLEKKLGRMGRGKFLANLENSPWHSRG